MCSEIVGVDLRFEIFGVGGCCDCVSWDERKCYLIGLIERGYVWYWLIVMIVMISNVFLGGFCDNICMNVGRNKVVYYKNF